ncbi:MAG: type II secretion system F family protein [Selenomonadaceae bacterium]|nr:type II secretion system F family protein [Selenomonadaceae bacterium]
MRVTIAVLVTAVVFFVALYYIQKRETNRNQMVKRMEFFSGNEDEEGKKIALAKNLTLKDRIMEQVRFLASHWRKVHQNDTMDLRMQQADWPLLGSEFQVMVLLISVAAGIFAFLLTWKPVMALVGAGGAALFCMLYLRIYISRRQAAFLNQLGDTLVMVSNALRAGFSFMQAMELISKEMQPPIGVEFQKVINEMNLGATLETAMENMGRRMQSSDFDLVVTAVLIQRQVGGNLSQVLDSISNTINERIRMRNEISSLTAQGKLSGLIVGVIPIFIAFFIWSNNPDYFQPMLDSPTGRGLLVGAVVLELVAIIIIRRIIDIDV